MKNIPFAGKEVFSLPIKKILCFALCLSLFFSLCACDFTIPQPPVLPDLTEASEETAPPSTTEAPTELSTVPPSPYEFGNCRVTTYKSEAGDIWAFAVAEVLNTSDQPLYLDSADFFLLDSKGTVLKELDYVAAYPQVIAPGERGYFCDVTSLELEEAPELQLSFSPNIFPTQKEPLRYPLSELVLDNAPFAGLSLAGKVENTLSEDGELVCIGAILFDAQDVPVGFLSGYLSESLKVGEWDRFYYESFMLSPTLEAELVDHYSVYAYPLLMQP